LHPEVAALFLLVVSPVELLHGLNPPSRATLAAMAVSGLLDIISFMMVNTSSLALKPGNLNLCFFLNGF
jgi:hypothetical protein